MHYHLYKNPKKNPLKAKFQLLFSVSLNIAIAIIEKATQSAKEIKIPEIKISEFKIPEFSYDLKNVKIDLNKLDKIIASTLAVSAVIYLSFSPINKHNVETNSTAEIKTTATGKITASPIKEEKIEITERVKQPIEVVSEKALNFDFSERYVPSFEAAQQDALAQRVEAVRSKIAEMLEEEARMAPKSTVVKVAKGDTLVDLLVNKAKVSMKDAFEAVEALKTLYDPRNIAPGNEITVFFHKSPEPDTNAFSGIQIDKDIVNSVTVKKIEDGEYKARQSVKNIYNVMQGYKGTINNSLYVDAKNAGIPEYIIADLIKMYSWNVDFQREITKGSKFEVLFEECKTDDGKTVTSRAKIVYAKLILNNEELPLYRFEDKDGFVDYFDDTGKSAKKVLMKTPINGARLSSGYGMRKHPVLGFSKMHKGVDFAAPIGTPVYASGDGIIEKIEKWSTYGNYIRVGHRNGLKTAYAHLKGFKSGLHKGSRVRQGEVIAYLGNTGRTTGPHLHYEVVLNNKQINPSSLKLPTGISLKGKELQKFKVAMDNANSNFRNIAYQNEVAENHPPAHETTKN